MLQSKERSKTRSLPALADDGHDLVPTAGQSLHDQPKGHDGAADVDHELDEVGHQHRSDAAEEGVDDGAHAHRRHGPVNRNPGHLLEHDGREEEAETVREASGDDEHRRRRPLGGAAEPFVEDVVGGVERALEVLRQQKEDDRKTTEEKTEGDLQPGHVPGVGKTGNAEEGDSAGLGGDDGKEDQPPRPVAAADHEVGHAAGLAADPQPEQDHADEVDDENGEIDGADAHDALRASRSISNFGISEFRI